jgi:hypothetical protein
MSLRRLSLAPAAMLVAAMLVVTAGGGAAADPPQWQPLDSLGAGDGALAERPLTPMFGDDPQLWPDWLEPRAVLIPVADGQLLVVRWPLRAPCGEYGFTVFGPVTAELTRRRLGIDFCAGSLTVIPVAGRGWPDLLFAEGRQQDPASGDWQRRDQRVRWSTDRWLLVEPP